LKITFLDSDPNTYNKSPKDPSGKINVGLQNLSKKILKFEYFIRNILKKELSKKVTKDF